MQDTLGSHSLKRGVMTTGMENMNEYLEFDDLFESHPLNGLI